MDSIYPKCAPRQRAITFLIVAISFSLLYWAGVFVQLRNPLLHGMSDFSVLYSVGRMVLSGHGSQVYNYQALIQAQQQFALPGTITLPFVFPPYVLIIFAPLGLLPYVFAVVLWYALNVGILFSIPFLLRAKLGMSDQQVAFCLIALSFFYPVAVCLGMGQITILTLLLFTLMFLDLDRDYDFRAGCILALALYKPQFVLPPLLALLITRNWRALWGFFVTAVSLFGISVGVAGWRTTIAFPRAVRAFQNLPGQLGGEHPERMPNLRGLLESSLDSRLPRDQVLIIAAIASATFALVLFVAGLSRRKRISSLGFSLVIVVTMLCSYHGYKHDMALLVLPLLMVAHYAGKIDSIWPALVLGLTSGAVFITPSLFGPGVSSVAMVLFSFVLLAEALRTRNMTAIENLPALPPRSFEPRGAWRHPP